ncbi:hypothetical protein AB0K25_18105 [Micromonospora sp. NPDC049257]|uniref:hypothetical protein n=1 Tax=Micromonospora sp. NPDC049257 TaxID=3155771 RepID=UPI003441AF70
MIERGSGRTSGLTDWQLMDVLSMWACLQDQETQGHWKHVAGWRKVCDLAQAHLRRLQQYRSGLAEAWPPATNDAAKAYLGELDELISRVQHTHDTAAANHDALAAAARAIDSTRPQLKRLHDEYATKLQQKRGYEATLADPKAAMGSRVVDPPVSDGDLERLNVQARGIMFGLSGELQQAQAMLQKPPPVRTPRDLGNPDTYGSSTPIPIIPPITPMPVGQPAAAPPKPKGAKTAKTGQLASHSNGGPTLGGTVGSLSPNPIQEANPANHIGAKNPQPGFGIPPTLATTRPTEPFNGAGNTQGRQIPASRLPATDRSLGPHTGNPPRTTPHSGVIGGTPGAAIGPPVTNGTHRRINPVGGVIGGGGAGLAPTGGAGTRPGGGRGSQFGGLGGFPPVGGGTKMGGFNNPSTRDETTHTGSSPQWDPSHPWATEKGVPPVVNPPEEEGPIDPGPAIGFNR